MYFMSIQSYIDSVMLCTLLNVILMSEDRLQIYDMLSHYILLLDSSNNYENVKYTKTSMTSMTYVS